MLWKNFGTLIAEIEEWVRSLDPAKTGSVQAYGEIKRRLIPLIGHGRNPPGYEEVPFEHSGHFINLGEFSDHDKKFGNEKRRQSMIHQLSAKEQTLHSSEAWDFCMHHLWELVPEERA